MGLYFKEDQRPENCPTYALPFAQMEPTEDVPPKIARKTTTEPQVRDSVFERNLLSAIAGDPPEGYLPIIKRQSR